MANLPKSPLWPEEADFLRILCYMQVPIEDANSVILHVNSLRPYLTQIEFDNDMDFLVLLNGITTKVVFTPSDDRANLVSYMIRELCEAEGFEDKHNAPSTPDVDIFYDSEESPDDYNAVPASHELSSCSIHPSECVLDEIPVEEECPGRPDEDTPPLPTIVLSKSKRRQLRRKKLERHRDNASHSSDPPEGFVDLKIHQSRRVNAAKKNVNNLHRAAVDVKLAKCALVRKMAAFDGFEKQIVKLLGHEAGELIPLQTFVSNVADLDWVQFRGVSDKLNRLMDRLLK